MPRRALLIAPSGLLPIGPCLVAPSGLADLVVRVYEMMRLCVEMRMPITIVSPMVPITMVPITKVQTPA